MGSILNLYDVAYSLIYLFFDLVIVIPAMNLHLYFCFLCISFCMYLH